MYIHKDNSLEFNITSDLKFLNVPDNVMVQLGGIINELYCQNYTDRLTLDKAKIIYYVGNIPETINKIPYIISKDSTIGLDFGDKIYYTATAKVEPKNTFGVPIISND